MFRHRHAVLFDLFGTLLDVVPGRLPVVEVGGVAYPSTYPWWAEHLDAYVGPMNPANVLTALRATYRRDDDPTIELPSRLRFRALLQHLGCEASVLDEAAVVLSRAHMTAIGDATAVPNSHRIVLEAARRVGAVGIVTNFDDTAGAYAILARHGLLERVDVVSVSEAVGRRKPHPLPVIAALRSLGVPPERAVLIGDSASADVQAAHAAGVRAVLIRREGVEASGAEDAVIVARLSDVPRALGWGTVG